MSLEPAPTTTILLANTSKASSCQIEKEKLRERKRSVVFFTYSCSIFKVHHIVDKEIS
jgi:hypothetical protein